MRAKHALCTRRELTLETLGHTGRFWLTIMPSCAAFKTICVLGLARLLDCLKECCC